MYFLTDKELKNCLLLVELFVYLKKRIVFFHRYEGDLLGTDQGSNLFNDCLLSCFEERIFPQNKSKLIQLIPIFVMGYSQKELSSRKPKPAVSKEGVTACTTFAELILSYLVRTAFPVETKTSLPSINGV